MKWSWVQYLFLILLLSQKVFSLLMTDLTAHLSLYLFPIMYPTVRICTEIKEQMLWINGYVMVNKFENYIGLYMNGIY